MKLVLVLGFAALAISCIAAETPSVKTTTKDVADKEDAAPPKNKRTTDQKTRPYVSYEQSAGNYGGSGSLIEGGASSQGQQQQGGGEEARAIAGYAHQLTSGYEGQNVGQAAPTHLAYTGLQQGLGQGVPFHGFGGQGYALAEQGFTLGGGLGLQGLGQGFGQGLGGLGLIQGGEGQTYSFGSHGGLVQGASGLGLQYGGGGGQVEYVSQQPQQQQYKLGPVTFGQYGGVASSSGVGAASFPSAAYASPAIAQGGQALGTLFKVAPQGVPAVGAPAPALGSQGILFTSGGQGYGQGVVLANAAALGGLHAGQGAESSGYAAAPIASHSAVSPFRAIHSAPAAATSYSSGGLTGGASFGQGQSVGGAYASPAASYSQLGGQGGGAYASPQVSYSQHSAGQGSSQGGAYSSQFNGQGSSLGGGGAYASPQSFSQFSGGQGPPQGGAYASKFSGQGSPVRGAYSSPPASFSQYSGGQGPSGGAASFSQYSGGQGLPGGAASFSQYSGGQGPPGGAASFSQYSGGPRPFGGPGSAGSHSSPISSYSSPSFRHGAAKRAPVFRGSPPSPYRDQDSSSSYSSHRHVVSRPGEYNTIKYSAGYKP